ncbi:hypothetical protein OXX69_002672 [Metschnikowia pulcherrima]
MDLIGEIVEHEPQAPIAPTIEQYAAKSGFPQLKKFDAVKPRNSRFKSAPKTDSERSKEARTPAQIPKNNDDSLTEAQRIHKENLAKISSLTEDELTKEREELLQGLDPKLVQTLLKRTEARTAEHNHDHAEGYGGWIGGGKNGVELPSLNDNDVNRALGIKNVSFKEEVEFEEDDEPDAKQPLDHFTDEEETAITPKDDDASGDDEVAPEGYQILSELQSRAEPEPEVHFPRPKVARENPELDLNDPNFFDNLHEKYFPDLPKETSKLAWMTTPMPKHKISSYDAIGGMRFDFKGNLVELDDKSQDTPTHLGLHHHAENPQLAGYTLAELVHLSRSVVPTQRCLGIQMLGRILHKLGAHKYNIMPIVDEDNSDGVLQEASSEVMAQFEGMMWDLVESLRVVESLTEASDEKRTRNLSVRNYALEALWLWKQGGGRPEKAEKSEEEILAENLQNM